MIEAEKSLISSMVTSVSCLVDVFDIVSSTDFVSEKHRKIVSAIEMIHDAGDVDVFEVSEKSGEFEYLTDLITGSYRFSPTVAANIVKKESVRRKALQNLASATELVLSAETMDDCVSAVSDVTSGLEFDDKDDDTWHDLLKSAINRIDERMQGKAPLGLMTGFTVIDERLNGIKDGNFRIVAARPAMGKTTLIINEAASIAQRGGNVLIFSLEMTKDELTEKVISSMSGVGMRSLQTGKFEDHEHSSLQIGVAKIKDTNINIVDKAGLDISHLSNIAKKYNRFKKLDVIYIDYLQLITSKSASRFEEISDISRKLKALAKTLGVPIVALSQLSRKVEERNDKRPMMSDLRESGQIELDADIIQFIYRDDYYLKEKSSFPNTAEIITSKFRGGETGTDYLGTQLQYSRFINLDYVPQPKPEEEEYRPYGKK